jgi:hypothetical protein
MRAETISSLFVVPAKAGTHAGAVRGVEGLAERRRHVAPRLRGGDKLLMRGWNA